MIRAFTTLDGISHFNVTLGLLTRPDTFEKVEGGFGLLKPRNYILAICDWCGQREVLDDPDVELAGGLNARKLHCDALIAALNWVTGAKLSDFCSRRCQHDSRRCTIPEIRRSW